MRSASAVSAPRREMRTWFGLTQFLGELPSLGLCCSGHPPARGTATSQGARHIFGAHSTRLSPRHHPPHPRPDGFHHRGADLRGPAAPQQAGRSPCPFPDPCHSGAGTDMAPRGLETPGMGGVEGRGTGGVTVPLPVWVTILGGALSPRRSTPPSTCCPPCPV